MMCLAMQKIISDTSVTNDETLLLHVHEWPKWHGLARRPCNHPSRTSALDEFPPTLLAANYRMSAIRPCLTDKNLENH
jgi:hypothetical protein